jgi:hypothetical protein
LRQIWNAHSLKPIRNFRKVKIPKSVLGSKPDKGGFCILETMHDRKTSPRPKLFVSTRRLKKQRPQPRKTVLGSSPGEGDFCSSETKHERRTAQRTKLFVSARRLREQRPQPRKSVLGSSPGEGDFCSSETKHDRTTAQRTKLFVSARRLQELRSQTRKLSWVRVSVKILGLGIIIIFCDIQRYVSNDQAYDKLSGNKD